MSNIETTRVMGAAGVLPDRTLVATAGMGATMQMPATSDSQRTQMGGTTVCPVCKSTTPLMDSYCGDCGFLLNSASEEALIVPEEVAAPAEFVDNQNSRRYRLRAGINTVGRQGTDVLVNEGTVSRVHARVTVENGTVLIEDLGSSNGTKVGDHRLAPNQPVQVMTGMPVRFGNWNLTLEIGSAPASAVETGTSIAAGEKTLATGAFVDEDTFIALGGSGISNLNAPASTVVELVSGGALTATLRKIDGMADDIAVTEGVVTVGRKPGNTIVVSGDAYVSGKHVEIVTDVTGTYLTDCGSTNGTLLNGEKIGAHQRHTLQGGDEVQIGQSKFRFEPATSEEASLTEAESGESDPAATPDANESEVPWRLE